MTNQQQIPPSAASISRLNQAVKDGETIWCLELLGVEYRCLEALERKGIYLLENLLNLSKDELKSLKWVGKAYLEHIFTAIANFSDLDSARAAELEKETALLKDAKNYRLIPV